MPIDLEKPLEWMKESEDSEIRTLLDDLQGNILKGHGREHSVNLFLKFDADAAESARAFVREMGGAVTSALKQLRQTKRFKESLERLRGDTFVSFFLTAAGYDALGISTKNTPDDEAFLNGMKKRRTVLSDSSSDHWEECYRDEIHALVLIADETPEKVDAMKDRILSRLPAAVSLLGVEIGLAMRNIKGDGIEHFGYVDGRSQPLFLVEDIRNEADTTDGIHVWNPDFPLRQVLVPCKGGTSELSFGSYFVFRKLEQDVRGFKQREEEIADFLKLSKEDRELAGAMLVGRFEDGTPVVLHGEDGADKPVPNNFTYESDTKGIKCPFHAHIRKTNPRGESVGVFAPNLEEERRHIMARRGITYGERIWKNGMRNTELDEDHFPSKDVGLLFMAYQCNIARQFEFTQAAWANNEGFIKRDSATGAPLTGIDPIIGQGNPTIPLSQTRKWGKDDKDGFTFGRFVHLMGGEYFYAPCISFLKSL